MTRQTPGRRQSSREYHARLVKQGHRKVTFWLSPSAQDALERLAAQHGSRNAAVEAVLISASRIPTGTDAGVVKSRIDQEIAAALAKRDQNKGS